MSTTMGDIKCTLTDEQLIEACDKWVSKFCESGGKAWTLQVPVNMNEDPDMLLTELVNRFKQRIPFRSASVEEAIKAEANKRYQYDVEDSRDGDIQAMRESNLVTGYLKRNSDGVKEIREGDVRPEWDLTYGMRHTMGTLGWTRYWEDKLGWDNAKIIPVHPGLYWAFPEEEGKIEYAMYGGYAIPTNIAPAVTEPKGRRIDPSAAHRRFERLLYEDGGYRARRDALDGGL